MQLAAATVVSSRDAVLWAGSPALLPLLLLLF
jgi:hypothetical protein